MHFNFIFSLILLLPVGSTAKAAKLCAHVFVPFALTIDIQKHIESTIADLAKFRVALDLAQVQGTKSMEFTALNTNYTQKENEFIAYLEGHGIMTRFELKEQIKLKVSEAQILPHQERKNKETEQRMTTTQIAELVPVDGYRIKFHKIEPGKFMMGNRKKGVRVEITKPFDMMATVTTQIMWQHVMELANTRFGQRYGQGALERFADQGPLQPIESLAIFEVIEWIQTLNELSQAGEPALSELIPSYKPGDVFRLPTEAEWEFVARQRGQFNGAVFPGEHPVGRYAWLHENSKKTLHDVATRAPLMVDGKEFYDMLGNVNQMTSDAWSLNLPGGKDPQATNFDSDYPRYVVRGASWRNFTKKDDVTVYRRKSIVETKQYADIGFRLVREVRP